LCKVANSNKIWQEGHKALLEIMCRLYISIAFLFWGLLAVHCANFLLQAMSAITMHPHLAFLTPHQNIAYINTQLALQMLLGAQTC